MLVLTRNAGERIRIGDDVVVTVVRTQGGKTVIGIEAPIEMRVIREELVGTPPKPHHATQLRESADAPQ